MSQSIMTIVIRILYVDLMTEKSGHEVDCANGSEFLGAYCCVDQNEDDNMFFLPLIQFK